jgi:type II secretory pathway component PulM
VEIVSKLQDALAMFWQALDEDERRYVMYIAAYILFTVAWALRNASEDRRRERLKRELREELTRGTTA